MKGVLSSLSLSLSIQLQFQTNPQNKGCTVLALSLSLNTVAVLDIWGDWQLRTGRLSILMFVAALAPCLGCRPCEGSGGGGGCAEVTPSYTLFNQKVPVPTVGSSENKKKGSHANKYTGDFP